MYYKIDDTCIGCGMCFDSCPFSVIRMTGGVCVIDTDACRTFGDGCGICAGLCPIGAVSFVREDTDPEEKPVPEKISRLRSSARTMEYLYADGERFYFMDMETFEEISLKESQLSMPADELLENEVYSVHSCRGYVFSVKRLSGCAE